MVGSAARALFDYHWARDSFMHLGFPTYIIYPLEIAKLLGVPRSSATCRLSSRASRTRGSSTHLILALSAHVAAGDGPEMVVAATSGLVLLGGSFHFDRRRVSTGGG